MHKHIDDTRPLDGGLPPMPVPAPPPWDTWSRVWVAIGALAAAGCVVVLVWTVYGIATMPLVTEEDSPGWDCHTMGNFSCVPPPPVLTPVHPEPVKL